MQYSTDSTSTEKGRASARERQLPVTLRHLEAAEFVCEEIFAHLLNAHGVSVYRLLFLRRVTPNAWDDYNIMGYVSATNLAICGGGRTTSEAYWGFMREFSRWRRCPERKCGKLRQTKLCMEDAAREAMSLKARCIVCHEMTTDFYLLSCGCHKTCKSCLLKQHEIGNGKCPSCRAPFNVGKGWREPSPGACGRHHSEDEYDSDELDGV